MNEEKQMSNIEHCAQIAHNVYRAYCLQNHDRTQAVWARAEEWQRASMIATVARRLANPSMTDEEGHNAWMEHKAADGWTVGPVKDAKAKTHPRMVPYDQLPPVQTAKDDLIRTVIEAYFGLGPNRMEDVAVNS